MAVDLARILNRIFQQVAYHLVKRTSLTLDDHRYCRHLDIHLHAAINRILRLRLKHLLKQTAEINIIVQLHFDWRVYSRQLNEILYDLVKPRSLTTNPVYEVVPSLILHTRVVNNRFRKATNSGNGGFQLV